MMRWLMLAMIVPCAFLFISTSSSSYAFWYWSHKVVVSHLCSGARVASNKGYDSALRGS